MDQKFFCQTGNIKCQWIIVALKEKKTLLLINIVAEIKEAVRSFTKSTLKFINSQIKTEATDPKNEEVLPAESPMPNGII